MMDMQGMMRTGVRILLMLIVWVFSSMALMACSSSDDDVISDEPYTFDSKPAHLGYWLSEECNENDMMHQHGVAFMADGTFITWYVTPEKWEENDFGKWEPTEKGLVIDLNITDNFCSVKQLTSKQLVLVFHNGWTGLNTENRFRKMKIGPFYIN